MIANDEQFAVVKEQAARLERALESLAREVRPKGERQFRIFAEGYVDQLAVLRADMDEYLGLTAVKNPEPDVEVAIEGPEAALGDTRVSAVTKLADRFRRALRTTAESVRESLPAADRQNLTDDFLNLLCDPPLQAVAPGSVRVQLGSPHVQVGKDVYDRSLELLSVVVRSVSGDAEATAHLKKLSLTEQKAAYTAAMILAPEKGDLAEQVGLGGRFLGPTKHVQLTTATRKRVVRALSHLARQTEKRTVEGVIREVDLDRRLFTLREADTGVSIERCKYSKMLDAAVAASLNVPVEVTGIRKPSALRASRLRVHSIRRLGEGE